MRKNFSSILRDIIKSNLVAMMTWNKEGQKRLFTCKVLNLFKTIYYLIKTHNYLLPEKDSSPLLHKG